MNIYRSTCAQYYIDVFPICPILYLEQSPSITINAVLIPMSQNPALIEPSFADAIAIIAAADKLPQQTGRHWSTSLRQIAKAFDKPLEVIPARYSAVRADLAQLHEVPVGLTAKTLQNHKSNAKSAFCTMARLMETLLPRADRPPTTPSRPIMAASIISPEASSTTSETTPA
jgi:hypothetical protein